MNILVGHHHRFASAAAAAGLAFLVLAAPAVGEQLTGTVAGVAKPARVDIPQEAIDAIMCGSLANASGPFDYRDSANRGNIALINANHFNQDVQNLVRGETNYLVLADLDFILRSFPNHYPALDTVSRYYLNGGKRHKWRTVECYFDRAMRFVPEDSTVRVLYGIHLLKAKHAEKALQRFKEALELNPDSAEIHYNIGLVYAEMKDYKQANLYAAQAYKLGYPLLGLRHILERAGEWHPPELPADPQAARDSSH